MMMMSSNLKLPSSASLASMEFTTRQGRLVALMDNGASTGTSCTRSMDGAIPGTFDASDAGNIGLGSEDAFLASSGSWLFVLIRSGATGREIIVRRMKVCLKLPMAMVFSEGTENKLGYEIIWAPGHKRMMVSPTGVKLELFMFDSGLGYVHIKPVTDKDERRKILSLDEHKHLNLTIGQLSVKRVMHQNPPSLRIVGMGKVPETRGVQLVRQRHNTDGHCALTKTVANLNAEGAFASKKLNMADVHLFATQGCGV